MRTYGTPNSFDNIGVAPDTVGTVVISSANAVVAQDWPDNAQLVAFGSTMGFWLNAVSTEVNIPTTNQEGATGSSDLNEYVEHGFRQQITADATGYSITAPTSGVISLSFWRK